MKMDVFWELCLEFEYDKELLLDSMEKFINETGATDILDCACGTGFLTLDLIHKGYPITCSDGSKIMLQQFKKKAQLLGLKTAPYHLEWSELHKEFKNRFDLVICRGCSLIYASSWEQYRENNSQTLKESLQNFYSCIKPGGMLYVDTTTIDNIERDDPEIIYYAEKTINGKRVKFIDRVITDKDKKIRIWEPVILIQGKVHKLRRYSYFLRHSELIELLLECNFSDITKTNIKGERYDVYIAIKNNNN